MSSLAPRGIWLLSFAFQKLPTHIFWFLTALQNTIFSTIALRPLFHSIYLLCGILRLPLTVYVLAMVGNLKNVSPTFAQMPNRITNVEFTTFSPNIANTMLYAVFLYILNVIKSLYTCLCMFRKCRHRNKRPISRPTYRNIIYPMLFIRKQFMFK